MFGPTAIEPATGGECGMVLASIEMSRRSWLIVIWTSVTDKLSHHELAGGDHAGLLALISRARDRVVRVAGGAPRVASCYEAGFEGFWLHRILCGAGVESLVIDPASLLVNRRRRRAKTDRLDAEDMVLALLAHIRGDRRALRVVRAPSVEEEDARRPGRERARLIKERVAHENRLRGLLALHGLWGVDLGDGAQLADLVGPRGAGLPAHLGAELERELARLTLVRGQLKELAGAARAARRAETGTAARIRHLMQLRGIGPETSTILVHEFFYRDFDNRRQVASAAGLDPTPFDSGRMRREQGIAKSGNRRVRWVVVEVAWLWLRYQPESALSLWYHARAGENGRARRVMIVALARKLLVALWRYLETGLVPKGAVLKR